MNPLPSARHYTWQTLPTLQHGDRLTQQIIQAEGMTLSRLVLKKGAEVQRHSHENEQITYILSGSLLFRLGECLEQSIIVSAGELLHIPAYVPHSATALEDTVDLDVFTPPRTDWEQPEGQAYLRQQPADQE